MAFQQWIVELVMAVWKLPLPGICVSTLPIFCLVLMIISQAEYFDFSIIYFQKVSLRVLSAVQYYLAEVQVPMEKHVGK